MFTVMVSCGDTASKKSESHDAKESGKQVEAVPVSKSKVILFFGNSLTAGMGLSPENAFPALIQEKLDSLNLDYTVVNAGLSGETTSGGKNRLDWVLNQPTDVFVLELGANDGLRGIPLQETRSNLQTIIDMVRKKNPKTRIILAGMQIPPNMGDDYTSEFRTIFPELAQKNNTALIPFLLEDVAGVPELNQSDGIHPTGKGHKILAQNVWEVLKDVVREE
tara:strand:- start:70 stop:732 length:663 start_codon:yes stop_codon:yes gene_type:complete